MVKCAGGMIESSYGSTKKSILVSLYELGSGAVYVIGHTGCGMHGLEAGKMIRDIKERGIGEEAFSAVKGSGVDPLKWLGGFESVEDQVQSSVAIVKNHPFLPEGTPVFGLVFLPETGELKQAE